MKSPLDLSPELLDNIASRLSQVDLLSVAQTCHYLRNATEPQLFREYINPDPTRRSIKSFLFTVIRRHEMRSFVHRVDLSGWETLDTWTSRVLKSDEHSETPTASGECEAREFEEDMDIDQDNADDDEDDEEEEDDEISNVIARITQLTQAKYGILATAAKRQQS